MNTGLAVPQNTALTKPSRGYEEPTDNTDILIPRAKLLQALSPEVQEQPEKFRQGMIINSISGEVLPDEFVPIFKFTNWIRFNPRDTKSANYDASFGPGDMIWRSSNPADQRVREEGEFGKNGERPLATKFLNFFSLFPGYTMPVIVSFSASSFKAGKKLLSLGMFAGGDMFSRKYSLTAKLQKNDKGTFYVLEVNTAGTPDETSLKIAEEWYTRFRGKDIQVHEEAPEESPATEPAPY